MLSRFVPVRGLRRLSASFHSSSQVMAKILATDKIDDVRYVPQSKVQN